MTRLRILRLLAANAEQSRLDAAALVWRWVRCGRLMYGVTFWRFTLYRPERGND